MPMPLAFISPIQLEFFGIPAALGLFAILAVPIVLLGMHSLAGLGKVRQWTSIAIRLLVLLTCVLILAGARWQRVNKAVEVLVLRDFSDSVGNVHNYTGKSLQESIDDYLRKSTDDKLKQPQDRVGVIAFSGQSTIDAVPSERLALNEHPIRDGSSGTDVSSAIQLALATFGKDAMHRLVLMWDGNATAGDMERAIAAASAARIPIDVMPLKYDVRNEVLVDRFIAPPMKRENEPFTLSVVLRSTNDRPVKGKLSVLHQSEPMDLDPDTAGLQQTREVTLRPGTNVETIRVPPLNSAGAHVFYASFEGEGAGNVQTGVPGAPAGGAGATGVAKGGAGAIDTLASNNAASAFTFVRGKGKVLYIENVKDAAGARSPQLAMILRDALGRQGITVDLERTSVEQFPNSLVELQNYDAVILANIRRGADGLSEEQQKLLAEYVHDMGGGLLMIGGEDAFGAGGWAGSKLEEVLPVNMDIPAQRQIPKGALVLVVHACEIPNGNYWGAQCAIAAAKVLSPKDEIGVITYAWGGGGGGTGSQWDFPLQEKGDGSKVEAAIKTMAAGDMPSFDDSIDVAINGKTGQPGLLGSDAKQRHIIVVSDGDPAMVKNSLIQQCLDNKITVSTITAFTHTPGTPSPQMIEMAKRTKGKVYGPIEANPGQLPQIFIKEATVVKRSLIFEDAKGIAAKQTPSGSDVLKGIAALPKFYGLVVTSKKNDPQIEMPLVAGNQNDPLLAHWQTGLGRAAAFTSDAHNRWGAAFVGSPDYDKFWAQLVRTVARPPMSTDFDVQTVQNGDKGKITVEALNKDNAFLNGLAINATVLSPDPAGQPMNVRLVQTGPGTYTGEFDAKDAGSYVAVLNYRGQQTQGMTVSGMTVNQSPEMRELKSNDAMLQAVADRTGGRVLTPFDPATADLFTRDGLQPSVSPQSIVDKLLPLLMGLMLLDVAARRIAWDPASLRRMRQTAKNYVRSYTTTPKVETREAVDALTRIRGERAAADAAKATGATSPSRPNPRAKFEASPTAKVEGDISNVVGGATDKPLPVKKEPPKAGGEGGLGGLMAAKRRAQEEIKRKQEGKE